MTGQCNIYQVSKHSKRKYRVIGEIDVLLTTGRLNENDRNALIKTYDETLTSGGQTQDAVQNFTVVGDDF